MREPSQSQTERTAPGALALRQVAGARIAYRDVGVGEPILLLHGYPQSHRCWRHQIPRLAASHRVLAPDWFGWGASERSLALAPEYGAEVERLKALVDALELERFDLFAHDYGGFLGLGFLLRHPERVRRFAILNSRAHRTFGRAFYALTATQCWLARRELGTRLLSSLPIGRLHRTMLQRFVARGCFDRPLLEHYVGWMDAPEGRRWLAHFFAHYETPARPELAAGLGGIRCPTAVVWGDADPYCPVSIGEDLAARIPGAELTRVAGADHFVMEERPDAVLDALARLLERSA